MVAKLEFFYDYVSVYSYLANHTLKEFEDAEVVFRPMFLGAVMQATGNRPPATVEAKGRYLNSDVHRWVARYGVPFKFNSIFPLNTLHALRLVVFAQRSGSFDQVHQRLFDAAFVHDRDLADSAVLEAIIADAGLDVAAMTAGIADPSVKDELKANTDEAVRRGVFGAPTFFVGDEMFFGNDRMDFVREALARH